MEVPHKKYTIFVSSTYTDLSEQREVVARSILELGHIPVGMEAFSAAGESTWEVIRQQILQCDYYVVIVGHRYGDATFDGGISYTEAEYRYAVENEIPVLGFILDQDASWPPGKMETDNEKKSLLEEFKAVIKRRYVSFWKSSQDLATKAIAALAKEFNRTPRPGWVRGNSTTEDALKEIVRLSTENAKLRNDLLAQIDAKPKFEILGGNISPVSEEDGADRVAWMSILVHESRTAFCVPVHRISLVVEMGASLSYSSPVYLAGGTLHKEPGNQLFLDNAGTIDLQATKGIPKHLFEARATVILHAAITLERGVVVQLSLKLEAPHWSYVE